jgi:hypothetical protein
MADKKVFEAINPKRSLDNAQESWEKHVRKLEDNRPKFERAAKIVRPFSRLMSMRLEVSPFYLTINLYVDSMDQAAPVIEELEEQLGIEFDDTEDVAETWATYRTFKCAKEDWLRIDANLKADGPGCAKVQVGEKVVPIYEIRCGEDGAA